MTERERASRRKPEEAGQKQRVKQNKSRPSFEKPRAWNQGKSSLNETPFEPHMDEHAALLRAAHSDEGRANLVLHLQQAYGNRYVQRLMESMGVQAKLTVNPPNDVYEQEADRVADAVTKAVSSQTQRQEEEEELQTKPLLQRQAEEEGEEEEEVQPKISRMQRQAEEEEEIQTKAVSSTQRQDEEEEIQTMPLLQRRDNGGQSVEKMQELKRSLPENIYQDARRKFKKIAKWRIFGGKSKEERKQRVKQYYFDKEDWLERRLKRYPADFRNEVIKTSMERIKMAEEETFSSESILKRLKRWFKGFALLIEGLGTLGVSAVEAGLAIAEAVATGGVLIFKAFLTGVKAIFDLVIGGSQALRGIMTLVSRKTTKWFNSLLSAEGTLKSYKSLFSLADLAKAGFGFVIGLLKTLRGWLKEKAEKVKGWRGLLAKGSETVVMCLETVLGWCERIAEIAAGGKPWAIITRVITTGLKSLRAAVAGADLAAKAKEGQEEEAA